MTIWNVIIIDTYKDKIGDIGEADDKVCIYAICLN